ncbi:MAG TPA: hypothetical protein VGM63_12850, partial [Mucilaginibacter sp.]
MLHQISWFTYGFTVLIIVITYYGYVSLTFYRTELGTAIYRLAGKKPPVANLSGGDFQIPDYNVAGAIKPENVDFIQQEDLSFGPPEENDVPVITMPVTPAIHNAQDIHLVGDFSEMVSEVKTLIRVI